jgi:hypothetical protein
MIGDQMKAVFADVIDTVLAANEDRIETLADEDRMLEPLRDALKAIKADADNQILLNHKSPAWNVPAYKSISILMAELDVVFDATTNLRHHVPYPVYHDWQGGNTLDGVVDKEIANKIRKRREELQAAASGKFIEKKKVDMEEIMQSFVVASNVFDPIRLPRQRIHWLENLVRLHDSLKTRGDGSEIRWRIYQICEPVENSWQRQWAPRQPLDWDKGMCFTYFMKYYLFDNFYIYRRKR